MQRRRPALFILSMLLCVLVFALTPLGVRADEVSCEYGLGEGDCTLTFEVEAREDVPMPLGSSGAASVPVSNIPLRDLDGTTSTLSERYGGTRRVVIVGRPTCGNTRYTVNRALSLSITSAYDDVNFLVLDCDGDFDAFLEGFGPMETDRVRFYSSGDRTYNSWAWTYTDATGSITLPFTILIDENDQVVYSTTGPQELSEIIETYFGIEATSPDFVLDDIDGTSTTMQTRYGGTKRIVIVGRPSCMNTQGVVGNALNLSSSDTYSDINFLVLDIDGDFDTFKEGFGSMETDRLRFYSSNDSTYSSWAWEAYYAAGGSGSVTLPFIIVVDENEQIIGVRNGLQSLSAICDEFFGVENPSLTDVDIHGYVDTEEGLKLLALVNEARAAVGASPLVWDADMALTAMQRVSETAVSYSHTRPDGSVCFTAWPSWSDTGAENIAYGYGSYEDVNTGWTNSAGHYANMINADMVSFGAALYVSDAGERYWVECFGGETGPSGTGSTFAGDWSTTVTIDTESIGLNIMSWSSMGIDVGHTYQFTSSATLGDADLVDPTLTWSSSNPSVATVDQNGLITGVSTGTADIVVALASNPLVKDSMTVSVGAKDISRASIYFDDYATTYTYTGSPITPGVRVTVSGTTLVNGRDYTVSYENNTEVGTATVIITGINNYVGTASETFTIIPAPVEKIDLSGAVVSDIPDQIYAGYTIEPSVTVTLDGKTLSRGIDYTVTYENNIEIGTAQAIITGIGGYEGSITKEFEIVEEEDDAIFIGLADISIDPINCTYTGDPITPKVTVTYEGEVLVEGVDYILEYKNNVESGTAKVIVTGIGRFFHTVQDYFWIHMPSTTIDITEASVSYIPDQTYTGDAIEPAVTVMLDGEVLTAGTDYTIEYQGNTEAGTATVIITGINDYRGVIRTHFEIKKTDISKATIASIPDQEYTGEAIKPEVTVTLGGVKLEAGADYTVSYSDNTQVGTATATISGIGVYTGYATATFEIVPAEEPPEPPAGPFFLDADPADDANHGAEVDWMGRSGISAGWEVSGGREYRGLETVKRCDFAAFLYRMADISDDGARNDSIALSPAEVSRVLADVRDCTPSTDHAAEIAWLISTGISRGWQNSDGTVSFKPYANVARQDMAAFLYRFADLDDDGVQNGSPELGPQQVAFSDVRHGDDANHAPEVEWLASVGVTKGWDMGNGTYEFRGTRNVARQDMAAFMYRLYTYLQSQG